MKASPSFDEIFEVMAKASVGDASARVALPDDPKLDDTATRFALALNILLDDLAFRAEAQQRSQEELAATLDSIGDGVIATDASGRITRMNPVAEQLTGWSLPSASGKTLPEVFRILQEDTREPVESPVDRVLRAGVVVGLANHTVLVSRDGSERAIADSGAPIRGTDGKMHGVVLVFRDQTEERRAQRAVEQGAARLQLLAESSQQFSIATTNIGFLLEVIARRLGDRVGQLCSIRLVSKSGEELEPSSAVYHPDAEMLEIARQVVVPQRLGEGISGKVAATGTPARFPAITPKDLVAQTPPKFRALVERLAPTSLLAVPLKSRERVLGVITMTRSDPANPYTFEDERLAQDLADRAALAIENALLVDALRKSEARFRCLVESGIIGITVSDPSGRIREANDAFLAMVGYSREDFLAGRVSGETLNVAEQGRTDVAPQSAVRTHGVARPWEKELVHKDGRHVPILAGAARVEESSEESIGFILDLTDRRRAESAVRESEARKAAVMEAALDAIVLMDHEGKIVEFNASAERIFGYSRAEVVGRPLAEMLIPPSLREAHATGLERYLGTGEEHVLGNRVELPALTKGGVEFPAEVAVVRIRSEGSPIFTGYIRDISERKRAAQAEILLREKEAAQAANAELEAFSYSVAHDLRAPLRGITGFTGAFLEDHGDKLDLGAKAQLQRVTGNAERMGQIIDALLSLARLTRTELRRQTVDLTQIANTVVEQLRATEPSRSVEVVVGDGLVGHGDPLLLRAVLDNLLGNAWKFTRKRGAARIEFGCTPVSRVPVYFVRDNGAGFNMAFADRLFLPFQRLHSTGEFEGTGVGLATVARIIRRHGGRIWAEGVENGGATFQFTLPQEPSRASVSWMPAR